MLAWALIIWFVGFVAVVTAIRLLISLGDWIWFEILHHDRNYTKVKMGLGNSMAEREITVAKKIHSPKTLRWVFGKERS
jgi:hypothetical protein